VFVTHVFRFPPPWKFLFILSFPISPEFPPSSIPSSLPYFLSSTSSTTECDACIVLQELPMTTPVRIKLPSELFGDMMMVLEFLNVFGNLFDIKDEFPSGLSFCKYKTCVLLSWILLLVWGPSGVVVSMFDFRYIGMRGRGREVKPGLFLRVAI